MPDATGTTTVTDTVNTEVAVVDSDDKTDEKTKYDPDWKHERIEYQGDDLAVRKPKMCTLMAYQLNSSKYVSPEKQNNITGLLVDSHIGPESYDRIMQRFMDPDDPDYTTKSVAELMGLLVKMTMDEVNAESAE